MERWLDGKEVKRVQVDEQMDRRRNTDRQRLKGKG